MDAARTHLTSEEMAAVGERIAEHATHIDAAIHRLLVDIRTFDHVGGWSRQGARTCAEWLSWRVGWDGNTAREHVRVARSLGVLPRIDDALRLGEVSYSKVRAMTRVATPQNEALLLEDAKHSTGIQLEQICRKYAALQRGLAPTPEDDKERRRIVKRDLDDGMVSIHATLHPEEAELLWVALTSIAKEHEPGTFSRVDALLEMAEQVVRGTSPERSPTEIVVTVPVEALVATTEDELAAATTSDGAVLSAQTVRRLACDAGIVVMAEDANGTCVSVGRKTRTVSGALWRAVLKRDRTCRFPGCHNRIYLHGHHATEWAQGGETSLANVLAICGYHHRFLHEYGYRVEMNAQQQPTFFDNHGRVVPDVAPRFEGEMVGLEAIEHANAALALTASTALPRWDGNRVDYVWVIDGLCRVDRLGDVSSETSSPHHSWPRTLAYLEEGDDDGEPAEPFDVDDRRRSRA